MINYLNFKTNYCTVVFVVNLDNMAYNKSLSWLLSLFLRL